MVYAAAHVVADPLAADDPVARGARLGGHAGLPAPPLVAAASAWPRRWTPRSAAWAWTGTTARELIRRSAAEARAQGGALAGGAGTDQLPPGPARLERIRDAYEEQVRVRRGAGAQVILMASRALAAAARGPDDYRTVL